MTSTICESARDVDRPAIVSSPPVMLSPGAYRLPHSVVNPRPDRRKKRDWRACPIWPASWEFLVELQAGDYKRILLVGQPPSREIHQFAHEEQYAVLAAALVPCEESLEATFTSLRVNEHFSRWLVESGKIGRDVFRRLWAEYTGYGYPPIGGPIHHLVTEAPDEDSQGSAVTHEPSEDRP